MNKPNKHVYMCLENAIKINKCFPNDVILAREGPQQPTDGHGLPDRMFRVDFRYHLR